MKSKLHQFKQENYFGECFSESETRTTNNPFLTNCITVHGWLECLAPYYKNKLELKSNSSEILPVNCKFISGLFQLKLTKLKPDVLKSDFQRKKERYEHR